LATGHYARIERGPDGRYQLLRALDESKDQSYVLHSLSQAQLAYLRFPLGRLRKTETRELARAFGLPVADKAESQDICFVAKGQHAEFVRRRRPELTEPGPIVDLRGETLGQHQGLLRYTVGQRKGLGIAAAEPYFVVRLDVDANRLVVGTRAELGVVSAEAHSVTFTSDNWPAEPFECAALVRYRGTPYAATVEPLAGGRVRVRFADSPQAVAPGQAVVFYDGDVVLGGGTLASTRRPAVTLPLRPTG
jgi:tRNA-specific 2-thiouridylase